MIIVGLIFLGVIVIFGITLIMGGKDTGSASSQVSKLDINGKTFNIEIADTDAKRELGLSNRPSLPEDSALLFIFPTSDTWGIWMKGMHFPIDIIWLDANYRVVYSAENVSPESYPNVFKPSTPARYVLETNAGFISKNRIVYLEQLKLK